MDMDKKMFFMKWSLNTDEIIENSDKYWEFANDIRDLLNAQIEADIKTVEKAYLHRGVTGHIIEYLRQTKHK